MVYVYILASFTASLLQSCELCSGYLENFCFFIMEKFNVRLLLVFCSLSLFDGGIARAVKSQGGSEEWGYVEVRPKAHLFWWLYESPYRVEQPSKPWPIILWIQGGPGASGVGIGNFEEIGPLDTNLKPRNSTWLKKADLLFVDNPVGTGYSYVEDAELFVKTDDEAATDLTTLLIQLFNTNESLQKSPLYLVAESYGGKFAVTAGLSILKSIEAGKLKLKLGGVALGNSWISPEDFVFSWGPLLKDVSRLDNNGLEISNSLAEKISQQLKDGQYTEATNTWLQLETVIGDNSNQVDFYNFLLDSGMGPVALTGSAFSNGNFAVNRYSRYLNSLRFAAGNNEGNLDSLMNGVIKKKLKIIPANVSWGGQSSYVFSYLEGDFMKPRIAEVDELLSKGVNVTVYNGQLDVICATKGVEAWVDKLRWEGLKDFLSKKRTPLYCKDDQATKGFIKSYKNLQFYWILEAGHFVPAEQPCVSLNMAGAITQSPAAEAS
ncbi:serine carboxypeptidase-like 51 isoform X1 [Durio zibethinus]|uniref:Carboxypeptidase n=1 Tax=Durio zibethinus TaxID=66656 RepID=A0A6P5XQW4_DURZI|nr:serine carboxypeptidase-like 51 isoform X1 [Durio zibethinus]